MTNTVTKESISEQIVREEYVRMGEKTTICLLKMKNGFEIVGTSACVDPANFDYELGRKYAFEQAYNKIWELEGYRLQSELHSRSVSEYEEREAYDTEHFNHYSR